MHKKNILINAISIKEGGSLVVLSKLLRQMSVQRSDIRWYVLICQDNLIEKSMLTTNIQLVVFPWTEKSAFHLLYWYEITVLKIVKKYEIDLLFSLTNYLPRRKLPIKTFLLVQHAGYFSTEFFQLMEDNRGFIQRVLWRYKKNWVMNSIKNTNCLTVQTKALKEIIVDLLPKVKTVVIPHGSGMSISQQKKVEDKNTNVVLGYVTKYGIQKNFLVLIEALKKLVDLKTSFKLILTLDITKNEVQEILLEIKNNNLSTYVHNYGEVDKREIGAIYNEIDIFLFPSLVESFGMPMVEAISIGLPVIAADTPVNREILGSKALLFEPNNSSQLCELIHKLLKNPADLMMSKMYGLERAKLYSWKEAARLNLKIIDGLLE